MDEEMFTREPSKKSSGFSEIPEREMHGGSHSEKLMNETSAGESYRKKLRHGKKDNRLSKEEARKLKKQKRQGRKKIYKEAAIAAKARQTVIRNEDNNAGTDSMNAGITATEVIRKEAVMTDMPIIRRDGEQLLKTLLRINNPKRILEIGTCVGYSAIIMADNTEDDCHIFTCEIGRADYEMALANVDKSGFSQKITCFLCDATEKINEYTAAGETFDFVFMDAAKAQYIKWLPNITKLLVPGGILCYRDEVDRDEATICAAGGIGRRDH